MRFAAVAEVAALADAIPPRFRALVLVAAYTGLRVKRVDLLHRQVTVAEQLLEVRGRLAFGPTKTGAGLRTVTLPTVAADPPQQLHPPGLDSDQPSRRGRGAALP
jgi:hypothetical protein